MSYLTPEQAKDKYYRQLSSYEHKEIEEYPRVYYVGESSAKIHGYVGGTNNGGYDEPDGSYRIIQHDHIAYRYEILRILGKGSSGQVLKCYDHALDSFVALKIVTNKDIFRENAMQEIDILHKIRAADRNNQYNVIHMHENFTFRNHICIVFELLSMNLFELIQKNNFNGFSIRLIRKFAESILECLELLYKKGIVHADLKPENILLKEKGKSGVKIIDFGSACYEDYPLFQYIQSRAYRAPEVILGAKYGSPIDMWSLGCILFELYTGYILFPGEDEDDQMACIIELLGMPPQNLLNASDRQYNFVSSKGFPRYCTITNPDGTVNWTNAKNKHGKTRGYPGTKTLTSALNGCDDAAFIDFLKKCLQWDPNKRMLPHEALQHEFITGIKRVKVTSNNNYYYSSSKPSKHHAHHHSSSNHHVSNNYSTSYSGNNHYHSNNQKSYPTSSYQTSSSITNNYNTVGTHVATSSSHNHLHPKSQSFHYY